MDQAVQLFSRKGLGVRFLGGLFAEASTINTSPEFYESIEGSSQRPRRHWCFLGHILDFETSPPIILVKDINDTIVELSLKANARDIVSRLRKAHTVAILYAQRDGTTTEPEIRLENVSLLQIFPISLIHLIALRDVTQEFTTKRESDNARTCHGCDKKSSPLSVPGKGLGLIATVDIPRGTRILSESALILGPKLPGKILELASGSNGLLSVVSSERITLPLVIWAHAQMTLNGYISKATQKRRTFPDACRINHACDRNAGTHWIESSQKIAVTALKDISKDEEITINYLGLNKPRRARRTSLQTHFGFDCSCGLCSLSSRESKNSDRRLSEVLKLSLFIFGRIAESRSTRPLRELREFDQLIRLHNEQETGIADVGRIYVGIAERVLKYSDLARGKVFAERAISDFKIVYGSDCIEIQKWGYLLENPTEYGLFGHSKAWKATADEIPTALSPEKFEDWLWKRQRVSSVERIVDFRSRATFPPISHLPFSSNSDYYEINESSCSRARNHWCFFGEITHKTKFGKSSLAVKDVDGEDIKLAFETEEKGGELPPNKIELGYTVAIINARPHKFPIGDKNYVGKIGVLHDDELCLKKRMVKECVMGVRTNQPRWPSAKNVQCSGIAVGLAK
ncbi:set domain-containing protein 5 [Botrytis cinerea]